MQEHIKLFLTDSEFNSLKSRYNIPSIATSYESARSIPEGIGLVITSFQSLEESILSFLQVRLLGYEHGLNEKTFQGLTNKVSFGNLLQMVKVIAVSNEYEKIDDLKIALRLANLGEQTRNLIVHSRWFASGLRVKIVSSKSGDIGYKHENYSEEDLFAISQRMRNLNGFFHLLMSEGLVTIKK